MATITIRTTTENQFNALILLAKELKIDYSTSDNENAFLRKLKRAANDAKKIAAGEMKGETFDSLFDSK